MPLSATLLAFDRRSLLIVKEEKEDGNHRLGKMLLRHAHLRLVVFDATHEVILKVILKWIS